MRVGGIKDGDVLWDYHSYRMGNTTMRAWGNWRVSVLKVDRDESGAVTGALVSWNGNRSEHWSVSRLSKLRQSRGPARKVF